MRRIVIDLDARRVSVDDQFMDLSPNSYWLLVYLARYPGVVRSRDQIREAMDKPPEIEGTSIDSMVKRLRNAGFRDEVRTLYGMGYVWDAPRPTIIQRMVQAEIPAGVSTMALQTEPCQTIDHADAALASLTQPYLKSGWRLASWSLSWPTEADSAHGVAVLARAI